MVTPLYKDLTHRDDVLANLERSWNDRDSTRYDELLDEDFVFVFSATDFTLGITPQNWDRAADLTAAGNVFDPGYQGPRGRVTGIDLKLTYASGGWAAVTPDTLLYPGEIWYEKTVAYDLTVDAEPNITYRAAGLNVQILVRMLEHSGKQFWQMVEMRDDVPAGVPASAHAAENSTWGSIKSLYSL